MADDKKQTGAVIIFNEGVDPEYARALIAQFRSKTEHVVVREFDPWYGSPVWYIP